jgi:hypothetical protein
MTVSPSDILLTDRVAVVTGGGAGIGRGIAAGMAAFGASVAIWEREADSCAESAKAIGALGIVTDVRDSDQVHAAYEQTVARLGPATILVNNAGGVFFSPLLDTSENGWDALYKPICAMSCRALNWWPASWWMPFRRAGPDTSTKSPALQSFWLLTWRAITTPAPAGSSSDQAS